MAPLRNILRLNAFTCVTFGVLFLAIPSSVGTFLGAVPDLALQLIGAALVINAAHLSVVSFKPGIAAFEVYYFASGDIIWFIASITLLASGAFITTDAGVHTTLIVALFVVFIGLRQLWVNAEIRESGVPTNSETQAWFLPSTLSRWGAIGTSWAGLKTWVKIWLFTLNIVFLAAIAYWPMPLAKYTVTAFVVSGALLLALMIVQRGLTRLLGLAHLIAWLPLLGYLALRLTGNDDGPQILASGDPVLFGWVSLLTAMIAICLSFDLYDIARWFGGKRGRLGSPSEIGLQV